MRGGALIVRLVVFALVVASLATARAEDESPRVRARALFKAGEALYSSGDYRGSIDHYQKAYQLAPLPLLLFDLAQAHRQLGERSEALKLYRQYLAADPTGRGAAEAAQHIEVLTASLAKDPEPAPPAEAKVPREERPPEPAPVPPPTETMARSAPRPLRAVGWSLLGVGAVSVGVGGAFVALAKQANDRFLEPGEYDPSAERDRRRFANASYGMFAIGGAFVAGGVALIVVDALGQKRRLERASR